MLLGERIGDQASSLAKVEGEDCDLSQSELLKKIQWSSRTEICF